ncbi:Lon protease-like, mitochondrial [Porphyridium purpureum]|uniref:Lon protease homolog n=1 Tax=Porphyridium purpureum TaxID=35688 RepID=A0A5J4YRB2_PORPP|nr:Lon protease-like, mitochondrial [Porphyridium purpureum]|eukprot:POR6778..scf296_7
MCLMMQTHHVGMGIASRRPVRDVSSRMAHVIRRASSDARMQHGVASEVHRAGQRVELVPGRSATGGLQCLYGGRLVKGWANDNPSSRLLRRLLQHSQHDGAVARGLQRLPHQSLQHNATGFPRSVLEYQALRPVQEYLCESGRKSAMSLSTSNIHVQPNMWSKSGTRSLHLNGARGLCSSSSGGGSHGSDGEGKSRSKRKSSRRSREEKGKDSIAKEGAEDELEWISERDVKSNGKSSSSSSASAAESSQKDIQSSGHDRPEEGDEKAQARRVSEHNSNQESEQDVDHSESQSQDEASLSSDAVLSSSSSALFRRTGPRRSWLTKNEELPAVPLFRRPLFPGVNALIVVQDAAVAEVFVRLKEAGVTHVALFLHKKVGLQSFALNEPNESDGAGDAQGAEAGGSPLGEINNSAVLLSADEQLQQLHRVGVLAEIIGIAPRAKGTIEITFSGHQRVRWERMVRSDPILTLEVSPFAEKRVDIQNKSVRAYSFAVIQALRELLLQGSFYKEQLELLLESLDINNPYHLADLGACLTMADPQKLQEVLEEADLEKRMSKTLALLLSELEMIKVQRQINKQIEENVSAAQRKFFLNEQLKTIKKELGLEKDEKETLSQRFRARLEGKTVPESAMTVIEEEFAKLSLLEPASSEFSVTRNYLDWLTILPWGVLTAEPSSFDIVHARKVLNDDHYGMDDVKARIHEFIAVSILRAAKTSEDSPPGKILLLSGPPGVGKTSVGKSIARALGRKFYRFSVGGLSDAAEIKGHRRTYVGAMPGKFLQALKATQAANPVILIDEIDKLGRGYQGDPAAALLEALDPEQNHSFVDHYLDTPVDLSRVLFIATANMVDTIPNPLYDRMDNIRLPGYIFEEKMEIARRYLVPAAIRECGMQDSEIMFLGTSLKLLTTNYCREAGVRNLKNQIDKIARKTALYIVEQRQKVQNQLVEEKDNTTEKEPAADKTGKVDKGGKASSEASPTPPKVVIGLSKGEKLLGKAPFRSETLYKTPPIGVATGLAWTAMGGTVLYIETIPLGPPLEDDGTDGSEMVTTATTAALTTIGSSVPSKPAHQWMNRGVKMTGQMGDVMKESCEIAYSFATSVLAEYEPRNRYFQRNLLHLHVPEGATPKDGPSAGITMVTAFLSRAFGRTTRAGVGMTGEVTLTGKVLAVGGIREKVVAAKRDGLHEVIIPAENEKDWHELPSSVRKDMKAHFASEYAQVLDVIFPGQSKYRVGILQ